MKKLSFDEKAYMIYGLAIILVTIGWIVLEILRGPAIVTAKVVSNGIIKEGTVHQYIKTNFGQKYKVIFTDGTIIETSTDNVVITREYKSK